MSFNGTNGGGPWAGLTLGGDGNFYGTGQGASPNIYGSVFRVSPGGQFTKVALFNGTNGHRPNGLVLGTDGSFYGTTQWGGENQYYGTVFKLTTNGTIEALFSFNNTNGAHPLAGLVQGSDGYLYGTTMDGGTTYMQNGGFGTVFKLSTDGALIWSVSFDGTNGASPVGEMVEAADGNFYGTTGYGGTNFDSGDSGTIFKITPGGTLSTIFAFSSLDHLDHNTEGVNPTGPLVRGNDGGLYGTTFYGGTNGSGTIFRVTTNGSFALLYTFGTLKTIYGTPLDGGGLESLVQVKDGSFYGTASYGGLYDNTANWGLGTVFHFSVIKPVVSITHPLRRWPLTTSDITIAGKAKGREGVADVFYQVNGGDWTQATTSNGWTNWTANIRLTPGWNVIRAYAVDMLEYMSLTNTSRFWLRENPR